MKNKIVGIIACQITLIVASYLILVFFENQSTFLGNTINISGKNRFLGELLYQEVLNSVSSDKENSSMDIIKNIDDNIKVLSEGGDILEHIPVTSQNGMTLMAVPYKFSKDLNPLSHTWDLYKGAVISEMNSRNTSLLNEQDLENKKANFIASADRITSDLSDYSIELVSSTTLLQIGLLVVNVTAHLLLLRIILRLIREEQTKKVLLEQMDEKNKKLEIETKFALIQKDISQSFIMDMEEKINELNTQIQTMQGMENYERNKKIIREMFQTLFLKIQDLTHSTIDLKKKTSDYEHIANKLRASISVLSENDNKISNVRNPKDLITILLSYIDVVNLMVNEQIIPPNLGRNLTDALYDIVDHMSFNTVKR